MSDQEIKPEYEPSELVYNWWKFMSVASVVNIALYAKVLLSKDHGSGKSTRSYNTSMKWLALPYVLQCAWRSFWPEVYNDRFVLWDCWMSSVFIGRGLATIGEITWIFQVGLAMMRANMEIKLLKGGERNQLTWVESAVNYCSMASIAMCILAEFFCNHGMFVENYFYNVIETTLWTLALGILIPCCVYLLHELQTISDQYSKGITTVDVSQTRLYLIMMFLVCVAFVIELCQDHIPMCYRMWKLKEAAGTPDRDLLEGIKSSMFDRIPTATWEHWENDWFWMASYFSAGVWTSIFMATGPRIHINAGKGVSAEDQDKKDQ